MADSRKRKNKAYYKSSWKKGNWAEELKPNIQGFIITCNCNEKQTVQECYRLLNEYAEKRYGPEVCEETNESYEDIDVDKALKKEVDEIKKMKDTQRRFTSVKNKAKNVIFIKTTLPDPSQLSFDIYSDILSSQVRKTKFCLRLLPVVKTCYAKFDQIIAAATPLIEKFFHQSKSPFTFCIMWKVRCNNLLKKEEVVSRLVEIIFSEERGHTTDYNAPKYVFNLDIIGNVCCFGFLEDYFKFKKYNLDLIVTEKSNNLEKTLKDADNLPQIVQGTCNKESQVSAEPALTLEATISENVDSISLDHNEEQDSNTSLQSQVNCENNETS
ncbi:THUMP domain-containing protein 1 isoform X1 [Hydra vulgaris]|nr:THUMP domain-containing protein 1-like [Hydra vulgaris]